MSKAFTRESDVETEEPEADEDLHSGLPAGAKNYITPDGLERLRAELRHLARVERPQVVEIVAWAAGNGDRSENGDYIYGKKRLREIDKRIRFLTRRIEIAEPVDPTRQTRRDRVFFGARVTFEDEGGRERTVRIVGVDETDPDRGEVSWVSPIARALLKSQEGDVVEVRTPAGPERIEVVRIEYPDTTSA